MCVSLNVLFSPRPLGFNTVSGVSSPSPTLSPAPSTSHLSVLNILSDTDSSVSSAVYSYSIWFDTFQQRFRIWFVCLFVFNISLICCWCSIHSCLSIHCSFLCFPPFSSFLLLPFSFPSTARSLRARPQISWSPLCLSPPLPLSWVAAIPLSLCHRQMWMTSSTSPSPPPPCPLLPLWSPTWTPTTVRRKWVASLRRQKDS